MKRTLLLLILSSLGMYCLKAQTLEASYENNFADNVTYVFENLDMSEVTSNLLLDRAMPFVEMDSFAGAGLLAYNKLDINRFGMMYATLYGAVLDTSALLPHPDAYMDVRDSLEQGDAIPLAVFHYDYHRIKKNAIDLNLLIIQDSQLLDVPNRPQSPYLLKKAFGITPLLAVTDTLDVTFSLPGSLVFSNTTGIALFEIDMDDGNGYQTLAFNQSITANYAEEGDKELLCKITLTDGTIHYSHAAFSARGTGINHNFQNGGGDKDYTPTPIIIPIPATADHAYGELQIGYGCTELELQKPLLYIQGYFPQIGDDDPQDYEFLTGGDRFGLLIPGSTDQIQDVLEEEGYDIIYLQLGYPGDFAARNAEIVKKAIRILNELKAANGSHEQLIVIGASMGGLLGKYALLQMEEAGEDHEVKTLITLDSPFRGANLPVGAQFMALHLLNTDLSFLAGTVNVGVMALSSFVPVIGQASAAIHDGFVQNSVIYNLFGITSTAGSIPNNLTDISLTNPAFTSFYADLEALGELQDCDFVALSNGSSIGEGQGFAPGDKLVEVSGWTVMVFSATHISFDLNVYALPDNPSNYTRVYKGNTFVLILGGLLGFDATSFEGKVKGTVPYDSAPGGTHPISPDDFPVFINLLHENICFVPTVSSLDIGSPENEDLYLDLSDVGGATGSGLSATDRYDASTDDSIEERHNQSHASLNSSNIPFLMSELASTNTLPDLPVNGLGALVLGDRTYNYGDAEGLFDPANPEQIRHTPHQLKHSLWVENTGKLWVNRDGKIDFTDIGGNPDNRTGSHFDLFIKGQEGCETGEMELHITDNGSMKIASIAVGNTADVYVQEGSKIFVENGGELVMEDKSKVIVESGAEVIIEQGGLYQTHWTSETIIKEGGLFQVKSGGILRLVDFSKLLVEPGAQLILEDGALVQLWDPAEEDGRANIHIQGELIINGDFDFSGSGYFQFDAGHKLSMADGVVFRLEGEGKGIRFLKLNKGAQLSIGDHDIRLSDGEVEYEPVTTIDLDGGSAGFVNVDFTQLGNSPLASALTALDGPERIYATNCTFKDLDNGISARGIQGLAVGNFFLYLNVNNCQFYDCAFGIEVRNTPSVSISRSEFRSNADYSHFGLGLFSVDNAYVIGSDFSNYKSSLGSVYLYDVADYNMIGGDVHNNIIGIKATGQSNIDMTSKATVAENETGIEMEGGLSYGVLTMSCARLLDNTIVGVIGNDVGLNIDASGELKSNHFSTTGPPLFKICYDQLADIVGSSIDAKDNLWDGPINYKLYSSDAPAFVSCNHYYGNVDLVTDPQGVKFSCSGGEIPNETPESETPEPPLPGFTGGDPNCKTIDNDKLYDTYFEAYEKYLVESHTESDKRLESDILYYQIAFMPEDSIKYYDKKCRQLIHFARSRIGLKTERLPSKSVVTDGISHRHLNEPLSIHSNDNYLKVYPNPAKDVFKLDLGSKEYQVKVFNIFGELFYSDIISGSSRVSAKSWSQGLYIIEAINTETKEVLFGKVNILR